MAASPTVSATCAQESPKLLFEISEEAAAWDGGRDSFQIINSMFAPVGASSPAYVAHQMMLLFIKIGREVAEGHRPWSKPKFHDFYMQWLWNLILYIATKLPSNGTEQERLAHLVLEFGKYFHQVPERVPEKYKRPPLSFMRNRLGRLIDQERIPVFDDHLYQEQWDMIRFDWSEFRTTTQSAYEILRRLDDASVNTTNLHGFLARLTRDGSHNFSRVAIFPLRLVLESQSHPGDRLFYHPVALARNLPHERVPEARTYPAFPFQAETTATSQAPADHTLIMAEGHFKMAVCWIQIAGKELLYRQWSWNSVHGDPVLCPGLAFKKQHNATFLDRWQFWTKRFGEIARSHYANHQIQQMASDCTDRMSNVSVMALLGPQRQMNKMQDQARDQHSTTKNKYTFEKHLEDIRREQWNLRQVRDDASPQHSIEVQTSHASLVPASGRKDPLKQNAEIHRHSGVPIDKDAAARTSRGSSSPSLARKDSTNLPFFDKDQSFAGLPLSAKSKGSSAPLRTKR
ncbi:uncharacterized protein LY89DRAFT_29113 [Mollisia scopiformis]|uniref:Uncharacterized protein n=1 Tax=Mollisia scopiformis TaxID=149040 RepID=A0A194XDQ0_MOLSC|nr:uncharacterized protein LY89DRAFT_29113 [Mollisia scopiformis]KUJ17877.1 hypothetical protein LY89DRAFT_29113 [Mollisia scopiformis]